MYRKIPTTENEIWSECIRMWHDCAVDPKYIILGNIATRKIQWLKDNKYNYLKIESSCFFCEFAKENYACTACPGIKINSKFRCTDINYNYRDEPIKFYKELLRLNEIRLSKRGGKCYSG